MIYSDTLYGKQEINEPWVLDIINHPSFLRLKGVGQYGYIVPYYPEAQTTRFEHSIGVFLLLRKFGLSKEEQLAGLLHDISHTVFSHCIDYVFNEKTPELQTYQDDHHEKYIRSDSISKLVRKHGFRVSDVVNYKNYKALELCLPDLCADRIDYILRDGMSFGVISQDRARDILSELKLENGVWIFKELIAAKDLSFLFKKMNNDFYAAPWTANMHSTVGSFLRLALEKKYISFNDLYSSDQEVIKKINQNFHDEELKKLWKMMNEPDFVLDEKNYDVVVKTKSRVVDPWLMVYDNKKRFSDVDKNWRTVVKSEVKPKKYYIKFKKNE